MHLFFSLLIFLSLSKVVFSSECGPDTDLNTMQPLASMPIVDQDGAGLCYAYAAGQLIEFISKVQGIPSYPSGVDLAMTKGEGIFFDRDKLSGGLAYKVIKAAQKKGISSRKCVEDKIKRFVGNSTMNSAQFAQLLDIIYDKFEWSFSTTKELSELERKLEEGKRNFQDRDFSDLRSCEFHDALKGLQQMWLLGKSTTKVLKAIIGDCPKLTVPEFDMEVILRKAKDTNDDRIQDLVNSNLNRYRPVVIDFCSKILANEGDISYRKKSDIYGCGDHSALVVGKRNNNGCEYLIRNSWGASWSPGHLKCAFKTSDGSYYPDEDAWNKKFDSIQDVTAQGEMREFFMNRVYVGCWVKADLLIKNTDGVEAIK